MRGNIVWTINTVENPLNMYMKDPITGPNIIPTPPNNSTFIFILSSSFENKIPIIAYREVSIAATAPPYKILAM